MSLLCLHDECPGLFGKAFCAKAILMLWNNDFFFHFLHYNFLVRQWTWVATYLKVTRLWLSCLLKNHVLCFLRFVSCASLLANFVNLMIALRWNTKGWGEYRSCLFLRWHVFKKKKKKGKKSKQMGENWNIDNA
jgi:hypothetical protein